MVHAWQVKQVIITIIACYVWIRNTLSFLRTIVPPPPLSKINIPHLKFICYKKIGGLRKKV